MRAAIKRDDSCLVNHLGLKDDVVARLNDLDIVVVGARDHRRPGVEPEEAAVGEAEALWIVEAAGAPAAAPARRERDAAVGRIDDKRCALVLGQLIAPLVPKIVVGKHAALRSGRIAGARLPFLRIIQVAVQADVLAGLERRGLFRRQFFLTLEGRGPLERRDRSECERALEIGLSVRSARWLPRARLGGYGGGDQQGGGQNTARGNEVSNV